MWTCLKTVNTPAWEHVCDRSLIYSTRYLGPCALHSTPGCHFRHYVILSASPDAILPMCVVTLLCFWADFEASKVEWRTLWTLQRKSCRVPLTGVRRITTQESMRSVKDLDTVLSNTLPPSLERKGAMDKPIEKKAMKHDRYTSTSDTPIP